MPVDTLEYKKTNVYINGPRFNHMIQNKSSESILDVPYYRQLSSDAKVQLTRNNQIKDQLFYDVLKNNEFKTMCCRVDH